MSSGKRIEFSFHMIVNYTYPISITALCAQTRTNKFFESVASQHFQKIYWFV